MIMCKVMMNIYIFNFQRKMNTQLIYTLYNLISTFQIYNTNKQPLKQPYIRAITIYMRFLCWKVTIYIYPRNTLK